jgi:DNA-binding transcriptional ArsR family regulator
LVIKDPEIAKLLADDTRRGILHLLRKQSLSVTDLSRSLGKSHSSIAHHINLLQKANLVEESYTEKVRNMIQQYYRSTAEHFHVSYTLSDVLGEDSEFVAWREGLIQGMLEELPSFGILVPEVIKEKVRALIQKCYDRETKAFEEAVEMQMTPINSSKHVNKALIRLIAQINLSQDDIHNEAITELKKIIGEDGINE